VDFGPSSHDPTDTAAALGEAPRLLSSQSRKKHRDSPAKALWEHCRSQERLAIHPAADGDRLDRQPFAIEADAECIEAGVFREKTWIVRLG
jgi:hypothetical protein